MSSTQCADIGLTPEKLSHGALNISLLLILFGGGTYFLDNLTTKWSRDKCEIVNERDVWHDVTGVAMICDSTITMMHDAMTYEAMTLDAIRCYATMYGVTMHDTIASCIIIYLVTPK